MQALSSALAISSGGSNRRVEDNTLIVLICMINLSFPSFD